MSDDAILDPNRLAMLRSLADDGMPDIAKEIAAIFVSSTAEFLEILRRALEGGDQAVVQFQAHKIKGSAAESGAMRVFRLAAEIEEAAKDGQARSAQVGALAVQLDEAWAALGEEFDL